MFRLILLRIAHHSFNNPRCSNLFNGLAHKKMLPVFTDQRCGFRRAVENKNCWVTMSGNDRRKKLNNTKNFVNHRRSTIHCNKFNKQINNEKEKQGLFHQSSGSLLLIHDECFSLQSLRCKFMSCTSNSSQTK